MKTTLENMACQFATVVVTGGSSGIGRALIQHLHRLNSSLEFCNLSRSEPDFEAEDMKLRHYRCDLGEREGPERAFREVKAGLAPGRVLLINNSGFGSYGEFPEPGLQQQLEMVDVNIRAVVALTGLFLPLLRARGGAVVNVASTGAFQPTPYMATYGASKAFVLHWSLALERELAGTGVRVLASCPGPTATDFFRRAGFRERVVSPGLSQSSEQVAEATLCALAGRKSLCVCGWKNRLLVALASKLPKTWVAALSALVLRRVRLAQLKRG